MRARPGTPRPGRRPGHARALAARRVRPGPGAGPGPGAAAAGGLFRCRSRSRYSMQGDRPRRSPEEIAMSEAHLFVIGVLLAWLAGIRVYLTVFGLGVAGWFGWLD